MATLKIGDTCIFRQTKWLPKTILKYEFNKSCVFILNTQNIKTKLGFVLSNIFFWNTENTLGLVV